MLELLRVLKRLKDDESGVAVMLTLSVVLLLFVLVSGVYSVGETIREKLELQNACDSAAYSAAVVQADGLSRMAMVNRALSWTYVQLTNMQMEYITQRWLKLVVKRFKEDSDNCKDWASKPYYSFCWSDCGKCKDWFSQGGNGWFCGVQGAVPSLRRNGYVKINGTPWPWTHIKDIVNASESMASAYEIAIPKMKDLIRTLNGLYGIVNIQMQSAIDGTIAATLYANLPRTADGQVDTVLGRDYHWRRWAYASNDPYPESEADVVAGVFDPLYNTESDEREFLSMADGDVHDDMLSYFQTDGEPKVAGGLDQWFIRSYAEEMERVDFPGFKAVEKSLNNRGICRVYKHTNRYGTLRETPVMRGHHTGVLLDTDPSCVNKVDYCAEQCQTVGDSVALYADWEWRSMKHSCLCYTTYHLRPPHRRYHHTALNVPLLDCDHVCCRDFAAGANASKSHLRGQYNGCCFIDETIYALHVAAALATVGSCSAMEEFLRSKAYPYGFARVYGDDKDLYNEQTKYLYVGEIAKPWILNDKFFSGQGSIIVALAKRQRNPWAWLLDIGSAESPVRGLQSAFNPTSDDSYLSAFSAGRAAFHYRPSEQAEARGVEESGERSYETRYDAVCDKVTIRGPLSEAGVGCVCGEENARRYARCWNLCETDWDATLLPVRFAWADAKDGEGLHYDGLENADVTWSSATDATPEPGGLNIFESAASVWDIGGENRMREGWMPFFDEAGNRMIGGDMGTDLSAIVESGALARQIIHMYSPDRTGLFGFSESDPDVKEKAVKARIL